MGAARAQGNRVGRRENCATNSGLSEDLIPEARNVVSWKRWTVSVIVLKNGWSI